MNLSIFLSVIALIVQFYEVEGHICRTSYSSSAKGNSCPQNKPKCCRHRIHRECALSCEHYYCKSNNECEGLKCCNGKCSKQNDCFFLSSWGVFGVGSVCLIALVSVYSTCRWYRRRKTLIRPSDETLEIERRTNDCEERNQLPFMVLAFENNEPFFPLSPPTYDRAVENPEDRGDLPTYHSLNVQTLLDDDDNHELNSSVRGFRVTMNDFPPPPYSQINHQDTQNGDELPLYENDNDETQIVLSDELEPPPYSLHEVLTNENVDAVHDTVPERNVSSEQSAENVIEVNSSGNINTEEPQENISVDQLPNGHSIS